MKTGVIGLALLVVGTALSQVENESAPVKVGEKYVYGVIDRDGRIAGVGGRGKMVLVTTSQSDIEELVKCVNARDIDGWSKMMVEKRATALIDGARLTILEVKARYVECTVTTAPPGLPPKISKGFIPLMYFAKDEYKLIRRQP